jgi:hypothetical protein
MNRFNENHVTPTESMNAADKDNLNRSCESMDMLWVYRGYVTRVNLYNKGRSCSPSGAIRAGGIGNTFWRENLIRRFT